MILLSLKLIYNYFNVWFLLKIKKKITMKRKNLIYTFFGLLLTTSALISFKTFAKEQIISKITGKEINDQSLLSLNWYQQSGELKALSYQAFNLAKIAFDNAKLQGIENPAVVVDIDETILDNSPYQASLIGQENGFSSETWNQWVLAAKAQSLPGAVDFINYVNNNQGTVFFVSNREVKTKNAQENDLEKMTIDNLKKVGFTGVNDKTVILQGEFTKEINGKVSQAKEWRRKAISDGLVDGKKHNIVVLMGDNLNDLSDSLETAQTNSTKIKEVEKLQNQFGISQNKSLPTLVVLPNPLYGSWEANLYQTEKFNVKKWYELTPDQKDSERRRNLIIWAK